MGLRVHLSWRLWVPEAAPLSCPAHSAGISCTAWLPLLCGEGQFSPANGWPACPLPVLVAMDPGKANRASRRG